QANHGPALLARQRAALDDLDAITGLELVLLVVRFVALTNTNVLLVDAFALEAHDFHDHGLVHLVAADATDELTAVDRVAGLCGGVHDLAPLLDAAFSDSDERRRSCKISSTRAMSLRALPS